MQFYLNIFGNFNLSRYSSSSLCKTYSSVLPSKLIASLPHVSHVSSYSHLLSPLSQNLEVIFGTSTLFISAGHRFLPVLSNNTSILSFLFLSLLTCFQSSLSLICFFAQLCKLQTSKLPLLLAFLLWIISNIYENREKTVSPSIYHEVMAPDTMILAFWMLTFKPTFSFFSFIFIKKLFISSLLSAIRVVSFAYLRLLIFPPAILIPAVFHPAWHFTWCTLHIH